MKLNKINLILVGIIFLISFAGPEVFADFEQNTRRYLSGQDLVNTLGKYINTNAGYPQCSNIKTDDMSILGFNAPLTGSPVSPSPSALFVFKIASCVASHFAQDGNYILALPQTKRLLGPSYASISAGGLTFLNLNWKAQPSDFKKNLIANMMKELLGPDNTVKDFGLIKNPDDFRMFTFQELEKRTSFTVKDAVQFLTTNFMTRDEFLSF